MQIWEKHPFFWLLQPPRSSAHRQVAGEVHRTQVSRLLGRELAGGAWEVGDPAGQGRMGASESLLTAKAHSQLSSPLGGPEPVLVGTDSQSASCPGGWGRSLRQRTWVGRAQTIIPGRPSMVSVHLAGSWVGTCVSVHVCFHQCDCVCTQGELVHLCAGVCVLVARDRERSMHCGCPSDSLGLEDRGSWASP